MRVGLHFIVLGIYFLLLQGAVSENYGQQRDVSKLNPGFCPRAIPFPAVNTAPVTKTSVSFQKIANIPDKPGDFISAWQSALLGADYLVKMQADFTEDNAGNGSVDNDPDDAGWDWELTSPPDPFSHSSSSSYSNLYGVCAMGIYSIYDQGSSDTSLFIAMKDAADKIVSTPSIRDAASLEFLISFGSLLSGDDRYVYIDAARDKFDARAAQYGSVTQMAEYIRDTRGVTQGYPNGIIAWDIAKFAVVAQMLSLNYIFADYEAKADSIAEVLWQDSFNNNPGLFDIEDDAGWDSTYTNTNYWYYTLGLTGLLDAFRTTNSHTEEIYEIKSRLLASRYPETGAFSFSYGAHENDADWQSTAYTIASLHNNGTNEYEINAGAHYLASTQHSSGGWLDSYGSHIPEIAGENVRALTCAREVDVQMPFTMLIEPASDEIVNTRHPNLRWMIMYEEDYYTFEGLVDDSISFNSPEFEFTNHDSMEIFVTAALTSGVKYYWKVRTFNEQTFKYSFVAMIDSFTVDAGLKVNPVPSYPVGGELVYSLTPTLYWYYPDSSGTINYDILIKDSTSGTDFYHALNVTSKSYDLSLIGIPLTAGHIYTWQVRSHHMPTDQYSAYSTSAVFEVNSPTGTAPVPIPSWPIMNPIIYSSTPNLYWYLTTSGEGLLFDIIIRDSTTSTLFYNAQNVSGNIYNTSLIGVPLTAGHTYAWQIRSKNGSVVSAYSDFATFTIDNSQAGAPVPIPAWPVGDATVYSTTPSLSWYLGGTTTGTLSYDIIIRDSTTQTLFYEALNVTGNTYDISLIGTALTAGHKYIWQVRSHNISSNQYSDYSIPGIFTVDGGQSGCPTPIPVWPAGGNTSYVLQPSFVWFIVGQAAGTITYELEIKPVSEDFNGMDLISGISYTFYTLTTDLAAGTPYHWRVRLSSSTAGVSPWSDEVITGGTLFSTFTPYGSLSMPVLGAPGDGVNVLSNSVSLSWYITTNPSTEQSYKVEVSKNADMSSPIVEIDKLDAFNKMLRTLENGKYYWRVQSQTSDGKSSAYSKTGSFVIGGVATDINEKGIIPTNFEVSQNYPNPFNPVTNIKVKLPEAAIMSVKIYNILGQEIKTLIHREMNPGVYTMQWDGKNDYGKQVPSGTYIYKVIAGSKSQTMKMVLLK